MSDDYTLTPGHWELQFKTDSGVHRYFVIVPDLKTVDTATVRVLPAGHEVLTSVRRIP